MTSTCITTKGNKCRTFEEFGECFHADGDNYACAIDNDGIEYSWEHCSANCSKECLPGQWKCYDQCIDVSEPCDGICKPSNNFYLAALKNESL